MGTLDQHFVDSYAKRGYLVRIVKRAENIYTKYESQKVGSC